MWPIGPYAKKRIVAGEVVLAQGAGAPSSKDGEGRESEEETEFASGHPTPADEDKNESDAETAEKNVSKEKKGEASEEAAAPGDRRSSISKSFRQMSEHFANNTYNQDLHSQSMAENAKAKKIWDNAEIYDENVEMLFTYVQVFTACLNSFAHGGTQAARCCYATFVL